MTIKAKDKLETSLLSYNNDKGQSDSSEPGEQIHATTTVDYNHDNLKTKKTKDDIGDEKTPILVEVESEHEKLVKSADLDRNLSNCQTFMHLFKAFTGPSTMGMPVVIKNGGLLLGPVGFLIIGFLNMHCNITVVKNCHTLGRRTGKTAVCYDELMEDTFLLYSDKKFFRLMSGVMKRVTVIMLILCQFGVISFYLQIIGTVLQEELEYHIETYDLPIQVTLLFLALIIIPYSWMRNLRVLTWFSSFANFLTVTCCILILQHAWRHLRPVSSLPLVTSDPWTLPLFVGGAVFTVEGIPMVLPLENRVKTPEAFGGCCGLITLATSVNVVLNLAIGFYCYLAYGDSVPGNILLELPEEWVYELIKMLYALVVFLTFTLQLYMPAEVIGSKLKQSVKAGWTQNYGDMVTRTSIVFVTYLFAALIPKIELLMSLVGAFTSVTLVFIFPTMAELLILHKEPGGIPWYYLIKDSLIFTCGAVAFVSGTYISIRDIILEF